MAGAALSVPSLAGCGSIAARRNTAQRASSGAEIDPASIRKFGAGVHGQVILPDSLDYDAARRIWNALFDKRPAMVVRCADTADVVRAVEFARTQQLLVAVRGGGHSPAGYSVCDGGMVIDLSAMKRVVVDANRTVADAGPGLTRNELLGALAPSDLVTPMGACSDVGIGGLTLGGGQGDLIAKYGLSCDALVSAEVVTADGRVLAASADEHPDLFWGLRGGAGNFGVVTAFRYRVYRHARVIAGALVHPVSGARDVLRQYRDAVTHSPDELATSIGVTTTPDGPAVMITACYCGDPEDAGTVLGPLRRVGKPLVDTIQPMSYLDDNAPMPSDLMIHTTGAFLPELSDRVIDEFAAHLADPPPHYVAWLTHFHGAVVRVGIGETAFPLRRPGFDVFANTGSKDPSQINRAASWMRALAGALQPYANGVYVNSLEDEGPARAREAYGPNYARLVALKKRYDPTNFFRLNQNVEPTP